MARTATSQKRLLPFALIIGVLLATAAAAWFVWRGTQGRGNSAGASAGVSSNSASATTGALPPRAKGDERAVVTLEEFADLQCPSCATMHTELQKITGEYGSRVRFIFRQFPLMNIHQHALAAALATEAAGEQGKFWEMQDYLYRNQQAWSAQTDVRQIFYDYARALNLDADRFMRDMRSAETLRRVQADSRRGGALGVTGTPTLFLNGRELTANQTTPSGLRVEIDKALNSGTQSSGGMQNNNGGNAPSKP